MRDNDNAQDPQIKTFSHMGYLNELSSISASVDKAANSWLQANRTGEKRITVLSMTPSQSASVIPDAQRNVPAQQVCWIYTVTILYAEISS